MKMMFLITLFSFLGLHSFGQLVHHPKDNLAPREYATWWTNFYTDELLLNDKQKKQTFSVILGKKQKTDSIAKGELIVDDTKMFTINSEPDEVFREILTPSQYMQYLSLQSKELIRVSAPNSK